MAELKQGIFNLSDGFVVDFVDVLQDGESADLADDSGEQSVYVLGVVSDEEELVAELGEVRPDALAYLPEHEGERPGALLVGTRRRFQPDVGRLEKVKLHFCTDVAPVADDAAAVVLQHDVVQIVDVVDVTAVMSYEWNTPLVPTSP